MNHQLLGRYQELRAKGYIMELLIIKSRDHYFRFKQDTYKTCPMNKASVFPLEKVAEVKILKKKLEDDGIVDAAIYRLIISEEPFLE